MIKYLVSYDGDTVIVEGKDKSEILIKVIKHFGLEDSIVESLEENDFIIHELSSIKSL